MRKAILGAGVSALAMACMSDVCETVVITGKDGPVRVNKSDYDADRASDKPSMKLHGSVEPEQSVAGVTDVQLGEGVILPAAPSAPNFTGPEPTEPLPIDPNKNAVTPIAPSPDQKLVKNFETGKGATKKDHWFVVTPAGDKITGTEGIADDGYATEQDAWNAILALPR